MVYQQANKDELHMTEHAQEITPPVNSSQRIVSVGAGRMGRGIAVTFAMAGFAVDVIDLKPRSDSDYQSLSNKATAEIESTLGMLSKVGLIEQADIPKILARISLQNINDAPVVLANADIVFEGVTETLDAKRDALTRACEFMRADAILASTTSTILSDDLQSMVTGPERFLNAHWLNPAYLVPLVELSPGAKTDPAVTATLKQLLESMGKVPVVCAASPGYIVPRIQALAMNEAARMVEEGVASSEDIDKATKYGFGYRFAILGMLEFIDWGGGDILYHASRYMTAATGDQRHASPDIIATHMREGKTGLGAREGFLDYSNMDVDQYQLEKIRAFVAMLEHLDKMPRRE